MFFEVLGEHGFELTEFLQKTLIDLDLNSIEAFQDLDASHTKQIESHLSKTYGKKLYNDQRKMLFAIKTKIRTNFNKMAQSFNDKLEKQQALDGIRNEESEETGGDESYADNEDSIQNQPSKAPKQLDPEFWAALHEEEFRQDLINKLHDHLKKFIFKFSDSEKVEVPLLSYSKVKLNALAKCPECDGQFVVQSKRVPKGLGVKWISSNMRKHYHRHYGIKKNSAKKNKSDDTLSGDDTPVQPKKRQRLMVPRIVPARNLEVRSPYKTETKDAVEAIKYHNVGTYSLEIDVGQENTEEETEEVHLLESTSVILGGESQFEMEEESSGDIETHELQIHEAQIDQGDDDVSQQADCQVTIEEYEAQDPDHDTALHMEEGDAEYGRQEVEMETEEFLEDDSDYLFCKTLCSMLKTLPEIERIKLKREFFYMASDKQLEFLEGEQ